MQKGPSMDGSSCEGAVGVGFYALKANSVQRCRPVYVPDNISMDVRASIKAQVEAAHNPTDEDGYGDDVADERLIRLERIGVVKIGSRTRNSNAFYELRRDQSRIYIRSGVIGATVSERTWGWTSDNGSADKQVERLMRIKMQERKYVLVSDTAALL